MAVSMNVDYTRQIYTGLSTDDWGEIEFNAGDVVYIMDQSQCWIFDGSTMHQLPDLGGGGGGGSGPVMGTVTSASNKIIIPIVPDKQNFMFYVSDPDSDYFSGGGRFILGLHPSWYSAYNLYHMKSNQAALPPTAVTGGVRTASSSDDSSITYTYNNSNTVGLMPNGYTVTYFWW